MSNKIRVSKQNFDEDLFIKSEKLRVNNKSIKTPIKSFDMKKLRRDTEISSDVKGANEIFRKFTVDEIKDFMVGKKDEKIIGKTINTSINKTSCDELNFCFILVDDNKLPDGKEIDFITNIGYIYSDATPLPLVKALFKDGANGMDDFDKYIDFMSKSIESINRLNNKPILGIIPSRMPSSFIEDLVLFYHDNNITSFVFDFDGKGHSGVDSNIRELMISINKLDISNESFTYSCNTVIGKPSKGSNVTKANDILVYNFGFDIMGDNHIGLKLPKKVVDAINKRSNNSRIRLFNSDDYGHYKHDDLNSARKMYPSNETNIPFEVFEGDNKTKMDNSQRLFNSERIGLELVKYRQFINENESTFKYLETKYQIKDDLGKLKKFKSDLKLSN